MPHQVGIMELERRRELVVDLVDDADWRGVRLVLKCVFDDGLFKELYLHVALLPCAGPKGVDAVLELMREVPGQYVVVGELLHHHAVVPLPGDDFEAGVPGDYFERTRFVVGVIAWARNARLGRRWVEMVAQLRRPDG